MKFFIKNKKKLIPYIMVLTILLLSVGYSAFSSNLSIRDLYAQVRLEKDIRITGVSVVPEAETQNNGGTTTHQEYNINNISAGITLPNANSSVTFNVQVTNIGSTEIGIKEITGLPDNLDYEILNYTLKDKICDENNICKLGIQKEIQVQIKYKEGYYDSNNTQYNIVANFNFQPFYTVTYTDIEGSGYPTEILGGDTLSIDFGDSAPENIKVKMSSVETTNYTYENGVLTLPNIGGNITIEKIIPKLCTLLNGESNKIGSKYSCDFGGGARNFYILELGSNKVEGSTLKDDEVALILEGNYDTTTQAWCASGRDNSCAADGLTSKLDDIAEAWKELEREQIVLPSALQIIVANNPTKNTVEYTLGIQSWLYSWDNSAWGSSVYGYWTSTPLADLSLYAWYVNYDGFVNGVTVANGSYYGVRPVVNLKI